MLKTLSKMVRVTSVVCLLAACSALESNNRDHDALAMSGQHDNMNAVLWIQTSTEWEGGSRTVFQAATDKLRGLVNTTGVTGDLDQAAAFNCVAGRHCQAIAAAGLTPAVILDIDETVLDNSIYQARLVATSGSFDSATWDDWLAERAAPAVPGVIEFIEAAQDLDVAVIYLTNRSCGARPGSVDTCPQREDTLVNMQQVGIPLLKRADQLILRAQRPEWDQSEKKIRRAHVAKEHRILMLIGDDLGDFASDIKRKPLSDRRALADKNRHLFGQHWFQLSNPAYGSWERAVPRPKKDALILEADRAN